MQNPYTAHFPANAIDLALLPPQARELGSDAFKEAVSKMFSEDMIAFGLEGTVTVTDQKITVEWRDTGKAKSDGVQRAVNLLRQGDYQRGVWILKLLESSHGDDPNLHFNLGAALSDLNRYDEARDHLSKALAIDADHIDARTTLGLSYAREKRLDEAIPILEEAGKRAPDNPYVWRALGGTLRLMDGRQEDAVKAMQKATELQPTDFISWLGLAQVQESLGQVEESISSFKKCLSLNPPDGVAEQAEAGINRHTDRDLRPTDSQGKEMLRMDAVMYMQEALTQFEKMSQTELQQVAHELALAGQNGLDLKDTEATYELKTLPGKFTAMRIVSTMYVAFQKLMPGTDVGIDLSREYQVAKGETAS